MQCYVPRCIVCISNKVEYLDKEQSYKISTKEVIFRGVTRTFTVRILLSLKEFCIGNSRFLRNGEGLFILLMDVNKCIYNKCSACINPYLNISS